MIITDEKLLRVKCENALPGEVGHLIDLLEIELKRNGTGIGLACTQIGIAKNVAIVRINDKYKINLVNAKIAKGYDLEVFEDEGCLSFPGKFVRSMRYKEIYVTENMDNNREFIAQGLIAVVVQHELDHLNSRLLPDIAIKEELKKIKIRPNDPCSCNSGKKAKKCCYI